MLGGLVRALRRTGRAAVGTSPPRTPHPHCPGNPPQPATETHPHPHPLRGNGCVPTPGQPHVRYVGPLHAWNRRRGTLIPPPDTAWDCAVASTPAPGRVPSCVRRLP